MLLKIIHAYRILCQKLMLKQILDVRKIANTLRVGESSLVLGHISGAVWIRICLDTGRHNSYTPSLTSTMRYWMPQICVQKNRWVVTCQVYEVNLKTWTKNSSISASILAVTCLAWSIWKLYPPVICVCLYLLQVICHDRFCSPFSFKIQYTLQKTVKHGSRSKLLLNIMIKNV